MDRKGFLYNAAPWLHLLFLVGLTLFCVVLFSALSLMAVPLLFGIPFMELLENMGDLSSADNAAVLKFLQASQSIGMFVVPPLIYFWAAGLSGSNHLTRIKRNLGYFLLIALGLGFVSAPVIELSWQMNQFLDLPAFLDGLEDWMRQQEEVMKELTTVFLQADGWGGFLVNMLVIAVLPAIGEELMFRGALQKILTNWLRNAHWAIFLTAFAFAFIHFQFFGFLPRFLLGMLFGYLFFWSGNIWVPIAAHFLNNGMIVLMHFLFQQKITTFDPAQEQEFTILQYALSAVLTLALLGGFYSLFRKNAEQRLHEQ